MNKRTEKSLMNRKERLYNIKNKWKYIGEITSPETTRQSCNNL